ncbi:MAG: hypothetical protein AABM67_13150, partial [Acidobacteriota bacterium]
VNCGSATATTSIRSFSVQQVCNAPGSFSLSAPSDGQSLASTTSVNLTWGGSANADTYDVYFGTSSNPPFLANQSGTSRSVTVTPGQTYFWKVVAKVNCGSATATTSIRSFSVQGTSAGNAFYDSTIKAPKCGQPGNVCDSGTLINGRDNISGGPEPNQPNTIYNSCADNTFGDYHVDESIDRIKLSTVDGSNFSPGKTVKIEATVWVWQGVTSDFLDLYYATDAINPTWTYLTTLVPSVAGLNVLSTTYTLPSGGSLQAVRAHFRWSGVASPCGGGGSFDDYDDLVFTTTTSPIQLMLDESGPALDQAAALDSVLFLRDPFLVVNNSNVLNPGVDRNTRLIIFVANLQLSPGETASAVVVSLTDSNGQSYDVAAEDVRFPNNMGSAQVVFRLPNNLPVGTCSIKVKAHSQTSNLGTFRIRI